MAISEARAACERENIELKAEIERLRDALADIEIAARKPNPNNHSLLVAIAVRAHAALGEKGEG